MTARIGGMPALTSTRDRRAAYETAFLLEHAREYPVVDVFEARSGYAIDRERLLEAARVLACPLKVNPPNWQHGRVLYSAARRYLEDVRRRVLLLDIGTAKGFSALCLFWALQDAGVEGNVVSVDVIDPCSREPRNTIGELEAPRTLFELLAPWPEASAIHFERTTGIEFMQRYQGRIEIAFVDGKHKGDVVAHEGTLLANRQQSGDLAIFDDVHLEPIRAAVKGLQKAYDIEWMEILPHRAYAIGRRK